MILQNLSMLKNEKNTEDKIIYLLDKLNENHKLKREDYLFILNNISQYELGYLKQLSIKLRKEVYGKAVFMRGLIEISNFCKQGCNYCGISRANKNVDRYRLVKDDIIKCVDEGYDLGYRTYVIQGGEDPYYTDEILTDIVSSIKRKFPDVAVTLSLGERSKESYQLLYDAGAVRYLLRHESASKRLYEYLHPSDMSFENRIESLYNLRDIGYQVGCGFMVGTPTQTNEDLVEDLLFIEKFQPEMCGIGPYLCHQETILAGNASGTMIQTLVMVALVRLISPKCLLPSTTALGSINNSGREEALKAGANVVMPNLTPVEHREKYEIYENKICTDDEAAHCRGCIETRIFFSGYEVDMSIGHHKDFE